MTEDVNKQLALAEANSVLDPPKIAPENLLIAEEYLKTNSISETARELDVSQDIVVQTIQRREVQRYIDTVYNDVGYRNKAKLGAALDSIIEAKLEELDEAELTSGKDIVDILKAAHDMRMDEMKMQLKLLELEEKSRQAVKPTTTTNYNTQINAGNYGDLIGKLLGDTPVVSEQKPE